MGDTAVVTGSVITSESGFLRGHGTYVDHENEENNQKGQRQRVSRRVWSTVVCFLLVHTAALSLYQ